MVAGFLVVVDQPVSVHAVFTYAKGSQKAGVRYGSSCCMSSCFALSEPLAFPTASLVQQVGDYHWGGRAGYVWSLGCSMMK